MNFSQQHQEHEEWHILLFKLYQTKFYSELLSCWSAQKFNHCHYWVSRTISSRVLQSLTWPNREQSIPEGPSTLDPCESTLTLTWNQETLRLPLHFGALDSWLFLEAQCLGGTKSLSENMSPYPALNLCRRPGLKALLLTVSVDTSPLTVWNNLPVLLSDHLCLYSLIHNFFSHIILKVW